ncbi:8-oxo-dGTP diphosphatase [Frankia sp. AgKG'84/4]
MNCRSLGESGSMNADVHGPGACAPTPPAGGATRGTQADLAVPGAGQVPVPGRLVVAVALLDDAGRVLAARRREPPAYAGRWEFPGGKVEPGEGALDALVRECREELDVEIEVGPWLGEVNLARPGWVLRVWFGRVTRGDPRMVDHDELRWLAATELDDVAWMPADGPLVDRLREVLTGPGALGWPGT